MSKIQALTLSGSPLPRVKLHPLAVYSILNSYIRRSDRESRVIGTLLGTVTVDGNVEVTDCFGFPHGESIVDGKAAVTLDVQMSQAMYACHRRINKQEQIVGWYATTTSDGAYLTDCSSLIHDFYSSQCKSPIHIVVDTTLRSDNLSLRGFVSQPMSLDGHVLANVFDDIPVDLTFSEFEKTCLHHMIHNQGPTPWAASEIISVIPNERERVQDAMENAVQIIDNLQAYVDSVVEGKTEPVSEIGISISNALAKLQSVDIAEFESLVQEKSQDLLMVSYLSTLTQAQLQISEKINSML